MCIALYFLPTGSSGLYWMVYSICPLGPSSMSLAPLFAEKPEKMVVPTGVSWKNTPQGGRDVSTSSHYMTSNTQTLWKTLHARPATRDADAPPPLPNKRKVTRSFCSNGAWEGRSARKCWCAFPRCANEAQAACFVWLCVCLQSGTLNLCYCCACLLHPVAPTRWRLKAERKCGIIKVLKTKYSLITSPIPSNVSELSDLFSLKYVLLDHINIKKRINRLL